MSLPNAELPLFQKRVAGMVDNTISTYEKDFVGKIVQFRYDSALMQGTVEYLFMADSNILCARVRIKDPVNPDDSTKDRLVNVERGLLAIVE